MANKSEVRPLKTAQESEMGMAPGICRSNSCRFLDQHPLTAALDKLIKHQTQIGQGETAHVEAKELGSVPCAELQTNVGWGGMFKSRIFNLLRDLI